MEVDGEKVVISPVLNASDFCDQVSMSSRIGFNHVFDIVRFECFFKFFSCSHILQLLTGEVAWEVSKCANWWWFLRFFCLVGERTSIKLAKLYRSTNAQTRQVSMQSYINGVQYSSKSFYITWYC